MKCSQSVVGIHVKTWRGKTLETSKLSCLASGSPRVSLSLQVLGSAW